MGTNTLEAQSPRDSSQALPFFPFASPSPDSFNLLVSIWRSLDRDLFGEGGEESGLKPSSRGSSSDISVPYRGHETLGKNLDHLTTGGL
ncbi:hypothetical protein J437_LFUL002932 [Ladona fulva]|uniref:Uncharacterized protein n=1 Tax=Ladona fulva TaxID=123851 RepID=A0A8K0P299_LADFU|nr:hypothetical protein J437_LFUL002932 [Ladona fulva]